MIYFWLLNYQRAPNRSLSRCVFAKSENSLLYAVCQTFETNLEFISRFQDLYQDGQQSRQNQVEAVCCDLWMHGNGQDQTVDSDGTMAH